LETPAKKEPNKRDETLETTGMNGTHRLEFLGILWGLICKVVKKPRAHQ
jgi:hypothetical protein